jgi:hypothetical protein
VAMDGVTMTGMYVEEDAHGATMTEMSPRTPVVPVEAAEVVMVAASQTTTADRGLPTTDAPQALLRQALVLDEVDVMAPSGVVAGEVAAVVEEVGVEVAAAIASPLRRMRSMPSSIPTCSAMRRRPKGSSTRISRTT